MAENPFHIAQEAFRAQGMRPGPDMTLRTVPLTEGRSADMSTHVTVCETCGVHVNKLNVPGGGVQYIHARSWVRYDHDPVPTLVPRSAVTLGLCDFCGTDGERQWAYIGDVVEQATGNTTQNYGHIWSACKDCAPFIDNGDIPGLAERCMRISPMAHTYDKMTRTEIKRSIMALHTQFIRTINDKKYLGPPVEPRPITPRHLPKIKQGLIRLWEHPTLYDRLADKPRDMSLPGIHVGQPEHFSVPFYNGARVPREAFDKHAHHIATGIGVDNTMYWISEDFTTLATLAGQDLTSFELRREELPSPFGLLVWARPVGEIVRPHGVAGVRAVSWTLVPGGIWLNIYILADDADPTITNLDDLRAEHGYLMAPNVGSGLIFDNEAPISDEFKIPGNFILTILATWFLMRQPGVATETVAPVDKGVQRSYKRSGKTPPEVRIVDLRRHHKPRTDHDDTERRSINVRFMVRGHWRNQAYGPKRGLRRPMYISPFIKGPENAPLKSDIPTVKVLR